ncbi:MAG: YcaQ family DNA glycosylase [Chloroflexi bacterium]|nr:YcaQ family DNA glycosylase [Chloroflexota bacterium]
MIQVTPIQARRLALTKQLLAGARPRANTNGILKVVRDLGCLQVDPISVVARSHQIVLWSRLGAFDRAALDQLLWRDHKLFEFWAHCASIVPTEDYPLHSAMMRGYAKGDSPWSRRVRAWVKTNDALRRAILKKIRDDGALLSRALTEDGIEPADWVSTGWTSGRNISRMLDYLWMTGKLMIAGREGIQKIWDLTERVLPAWTPREKWNERAVVEHAAQRSLRALGIASPRQIQNHFIRGRYPNLNRALTDLEKANQIERVQIADWKGEWFIHADDAPLLNRAFEPRTTLLSPFDNLICDRARTKLLFDFDYTIEIYTPASKRKFGYYVLPILHGDQLIGRIDPKMDRENNRLIINAIYAERDAPRDAGRAIAQTIEDFANFLGAREIVYSRRVPGMWKGVRC